MKHPSTHSVVSKHRLTLSHDFNWSNPEILHNERLAKKREIAEMFFIRSHPFTINMQRDTDNLSHAYDVLLDNNFSLHD